METTRYTVGWIAPLHLELTAARSALEQEYGPVYAGGYRYYGGKIGTHDVILGVQPKMGTDAAADLAARMQAGFPNIKFFLVVGIGGGVPRYGVAGAASEIVLGDVVVSFPVGNSGGVVQYDSGAWVGQDKGRLNFVGHTNGPPHALLGAVNTLRSDHATGTGTKIPVLLPKMRLKIHEDERRKFKDPGPDQDRLFQDDFSHPVDVASQGVDCQQCCDPNFLQQRQGRGNSAVRQTDTPKIHYGNIGSSNQLQISSAERNRLQKEHDIICFEMEGAGVVQRHPCLIVRGICDYSDSHKNKIWQPYAAATAAAYTRELLESMPPSGFAVEPSGSEQSRENRELLIQLRTTDPRDDKNRIEDTKGGLLEGSYHWILENSDFNRWRDDLQSRLLWIKGDPGKGKTMLLCGIINELNKSTAEPALLSYFFCQATDSRINNATAVLRGLLYLLADQQPSLILHIRKKYDSAGKALFEDTNAWVALSEIFTNVLQDPNLNSTYLIVDALDECVVDLPKLLEFISRMSTVSPRTKWIVSSRNWPSIKKDLDTAMQKLRLCLELNEKSVSGAVATYIQFKVDRLAKRNKYTAKTREAVQSYLSLNANGTFLWVALVCQEMSNISGWKAQQKLKAFPPGLDDLYRRMLNQIRDSEDADLCQRVLAVISAVYRPVTLDELASFVDMPDGVVGEYEALSEIIELCGSFLTLRERTISFIHQSAKDFLLAKASNEIFPSGKEDTHHEIFSRSLKVMSRTLRRDIYGLGALGCPIEEVKRPDPDPLVALRYSIIHWVDHLHDWNLNSADHGIDSQDKAAIETFIRTKYLYWLEALSLCRSMSEGVFAIAKLEALAQRGVDAHGFTTLLRDAHLFIMYHVQVIQKSPLQAYISALIFSPESSLIRRYFKDEEPKGIVIKPAIGDQWSACQQTLEGHSSSVNSVAFSHDSTRLASASDDKTIKIWDTSSGTCLRTLEDHSGPADSVAFSHDSNRLASASFNAVKIWDASSGTCLQTLEGHSGLVNSVAFSHNSTRLASASFDETVKIWDASSGTCLQTLEGHCNSVYSVAFSHDSTRLASASFDETVKIWNTSSGTCLQTLEGHGGLVSSVAFSCDSTRLASASHDKTVKIWDASTGTCLQTLEDSDAVHSVAFSHDSTRLASASNGETVKIWDASTGTCLQTLEGHSDLVYSVAFSHDSTRLASASYDETVKIWDASTGTCPQTLESHSGRVYSVAFSHDSTRPASASYDKTVKIRDRSSGTYLQTMEGHGGPVNSVAFSHDSTRLASASYDKIVKIWDTSSGVCLQTLKGHGGPVNSVAFSYDSTRLASASSDKTAKIWDTSSGTCLQTLEGHNNWIYSVAFSHDSTRLASASFNTVKIWDANTGTCLQTLKGHSDWVNSIAFSHNSTRLASASSDKTIKIWDASSGTCLQTLEGYGGCVNSVAFSHDSTRLASASSDETVRIWDTSTGTCLQTLEGIRDSNPTSVLTSLYSNKVVKISRQPIYRDISVSRDRTWICDNAQKLLWLPIEYRLGFTVVSGRHVGVGTRSGKVWIYRLE